MISNRSIRFVQAQTPPFSAWVVVKSHEVDQVWAQAKAEALLMEQIRDQIDGSINDLSYLKKLGVYTVRYDSEQGYYVHEIMAPDGVPFMAIEEVKHWWEAEDTIPMDRVPNGPSLMIALLPTLSLDTWRRNAWPDRPHP